MPDTNHVTDDEHFQHLKEQLVGTIASDGSAFSSKIISESSRYDFTRYEIGARPVERLAGELGNLPESLQRAFELQLIDAVQRSVPDPMPVVLVETNAIGFEPRAGHPQYSNEAIARFLMSAGFEHVAAPLIASRRAVLPHETRSAWDTTVTAAFGQALSEGFTESIEQRRRQFDDRNMHLHASAILGAISKTDLYDEAATLALAAGQTIVGSIDLAEVGSAGHDGEFRVYKPGSVNFGLQLVYRQVWRPVGTQAGEIVRTIPLGPGQSESVMIKRLSSRKTSRSAEETIERETEQTEQVSSKDSQEVVDEASRAFDWSVDATAELKYGVVKASATASAASRNASNSRSTKNALSETMAKTASRMRRENKTVVSLSGEEETEFSRSSEIRNENDETAVTYVYSKLTRVYEVATELAEVNSVICVAEAVPARIDMTEGWFRRHADAIARGLTDDARLQDLELVVTYIDDEVPSHPQLDQIVADVASKGLADLQAAAGSPPDVFAAPLAAWERYQERRSEAMQAARRRARALERLRDHITANRLHFARLIVKSEDPDSRALRYGAIDVPLAWRFVPAGAQAPQAFEDRAGVWAPDASAPEAIAPLSELVDPLGPIGFVGNYAAYYARRPFAAQRDDFGARMAAMRAPYLAHRITIAPQDDWDIEAVAAPDTLRPFSAVLRMRARGADRINVELRIRQKGASRFGRAIQRSVARSGDVADFGKMKIAIAPTGDEIIDTDIQIDVDLTPYLEDPDLKVSRWDMGPLTDDMAEDLIGRAGVLELTSTWPELKHALDAAQVDLGALARFSELPLFLRKRLRRAWLVHQYRAANTTMVHLDTDDLVLSRIFDGETTLEPFKRTHRYIDVLSALEDMEHKRLENARRRERIEVGALDDPDIETVIHGGGAIVATGGTPNGPAEDDEV